MTYHANKNYPILEHLPFGEETADAFGNSCFTDSWNAF
jgi:hypothetical protein